MLRKGNADRIVRGSWLSFASTAHFGLSTIGQPANRGEVIFLYPSLRECGRRLSWLPQWIVGDLAYISLPIARRIREDMGVAVITPLKKDMHLPLKTETKN